MEKWFEKSRFCSGDTLTIADFQMYAEIMDVHYIGRPEDLDKYPKIKEWIARCDGQKGIKEVHDDWKVGFLKVVQEKSKAWEEKH